MTDTMEDLLSDEKASQVFYVVEERDGALHLLAYPRDTVLRDLVGPTEPIQAVEEVVEEVPSSVEEIPPVADDGMVA